MATDTAMGTGMARTKVGADWNSFRARDAKPLGSLAVTVGALRALYAVLAAGLFAVNATGQIVLPVPPAAGGTQSPAADPNGLRAWRFTPMLSVSETYSDNVTLAPAGAAKRDWITTVSPGIHAEGSGVRVRGFFDYRLSDSTYANEANLDNRQNFLNSRITVELLEKRFFIETRASISQQVRSAFSATSTDTSSATANRVETSVYQIAPYWRGRYSDIAIYQIRLNATQSTSRGIAASSTSTTEWLGSLRSATPSAKIGWALEGTALSVDSGAAKKSEMTRGRGSMILEVQPDLHLSLFEGFETTDFSGSGRQSSHTPGFGLAWTPSIRTQVAAIREKRIFGQAQTIALSHRISRIALRYDDSREIAVLSNLVAASGPGTLNALMSDLLMSGIPDPALRAQAVNSRLETSGQPAQSGAVGEFQTNQIFLRRNRQLSVAALGATDTVTLSWNLRDQLAVGSVASSLDSFSVSPSIRQRTVRATWMHRLSPISSMTLSSSRLNTQSLAGSTAESTQTAMSLLATRKIGQRTSVSVGVRRSVFDSTVTGGNRENAVLSTLATRF